MKKLCLASALALTAAFAAPAHAAPAPVTNVVINHSTAATGAWLTAGGGVAVLSVMARAACVGKAHRRQLTTEEAFNGLALPFFWLLAPSLNGRPAC